MLDPKPQYKSRTIIGAAIALLAGLAGVAGYTVSPDEQASLTDLILAGAGVVGGLLAWYGRIRATRPIDGKSPPGSFGAVLVLPVVAILAAALLSGCAGMKEVFNPGPPPKVEESLSEPAKVAQRAINEANLTITAAATVIGDNAASGMLTKADAQKALDQVKEFRKQAKDAQALLDLGDIGNAQTQAELIHRLAGALHKRIADQARKTP